MCPGIWLDRMVGHVAGLSWAYTQYAAHCTREGDGERRKRKPERKIKPQVEQSLTCDFQQILQQSMGTKQSPGRVVMAPTMPFWVLARKRCQSRSARPTAIGRTNALGFLRSPMVELGVGLIPSTNLSPRRRKIPPTAHVGSR